MKAGSGLTPQYDLLCEVKPAEDGMTVKGVLRRREGVSGRLIRSIVHGAKHPELGAASAGGVYVNGKPAIFITRVQSGDRIGLVYPKESTHIIAENIPLDVLYEDEDILALNKQPGVVVHPTKGHPSGTIANGVVAHMERRGETYKPRFINRLDMDTSGVLLVGKHSHAQNAFTADADAGKTVKKYLVAVSGIMPNNEGVIELPIGRAPDGSPQRIVTENGAPSATHYRVISRRIDADKPEANASAGAYTTLEATLETGRTHQIRVHLAHSGHPVLGDTLYGTEESASRAPRQVLHAHTLTFFHPRTGKQMIIEAPLPKDIEAFFA